MSDSKNNARYNLASSWSRIFSKLFDLLTIILILIGFFFLLFFKQTEIPGWKVLVFSWIIFLLFFIWFIIIPFFTNGYTLFSFVFKIRIYSTLLKKIYVNKKYKFKNLDFRFLLSLLKRELFLWEINSILFIIFGFICLKFDKDVLVFIEEILNKKIDLSFLNVLAVIVISLIWVNNLPTVVIVFNIIFKNRKRTLHDYFSNTVVIKMIDVSSDKDNANNNFKSSKVNIMYGLPGEISDEAIKEIGD